MSSRKNGRNGAKIECLVALIWPHRARRFSRNDKELELSDLSESVILATLRVCRRRSLVLSIQDDYTSATYIYRWQLVVLPLLIANTTESKYFKKYIFFYRIYNI
jgi:hypothetical protein